MPEEFNPFNWKPDAWLLLQLHRQIAMAREIIAGLFIDFWR